MSSCLLKKKHTGNLANADKAGGIYIHWEFTKKRNLCGNSPEFSQNSLSAMRDKYSQGQHVQRAKRLDGLVNFVTNVVIPITNAA